MKNKASAPPPPPCGDDAITYHRGRPHLAICDLRADHKDDHMMYARTIDGRMTRRILHRWKKKRDAA